MISRTWRGWTTLENAAAYEAIVTNDVIPGILAMDIAGLEKIELYNRRLDQEVEFMTVMWFRSIKDVVDFMGDDYEKSHVPQRAREVLSRFDVRSQHYDVLLSRSTR